MESSSAPARTHPIQLPQEVQLVSSLDLILPNETSYTPDCTTEELLDTLYNRSTTHNLPHLIARNKELPSVATREKGLTLLHIAAAQGNDVATRILLENGAHPNAHDSSFITALHLAATFGHATIAEMLLHAGANALAPAYPSMTNKTALHLAAQAGYDNIISLLIEHYTAAIRRAHPSLSAKRIRHQVKISLLNKQDLMGFSPLFDAILNNHLPAALCLLRHGASVKVRSRMHATVMHIAADVGLTEIIPILFGKLPGLLNAHDENNNTPLHNAAYYFIRTQDPEPYLELCQLGANQTLLNYMRVNERYMQLTPQEVLEYAVSSGDLPDEAFNVLQRRLALQTIPDISAPTTVDVQPQPKGRSIFCCCCPRRQAHRYQVHPAS